MKWIVKNFYGFFNRFESQDVKDGVIVDGLNWMLSGDKVDKGGIGKIELRRGYSIVGNSGGAGKIRGLKKVIKTNGKEILFRVRDRKIEYLDDNTKTWQESGSNVLPQEAIKDDFAIEGYTSLAGEAVYFSSLNSSIYKIMVHNPQSVIDMGSTSFRGLIKIRNNRMFLWQRNGIDGQKDLTGIYGSRMDKGSYSEYTYVSSENVGSAGLKNYTGTLAFKSSGSKRSCFGVKFTSGSQVLYDNFDGTLTGSGSGTINYATGQFNITFSNTTTASVIASYYWEDPTSGGICDFSPPSNPRQAKQSFIIRQDEGGGKVQNIGQYQSNYYCFHDKKTWKLSIEPDDTKANNLPFLEMVGIPYWRAMVETSDGIYYVDNTSDSGERLEIKILALNVLSQNVIPSTISNGVDFSDYLFDEAVLIEWANYIVVACREKNSDENNIIFLYDKKNKIWNPPHKLNASCLDVYNGDLVAGDGFSNNVYKLYYGFYDIDTKIDNYICLNNSNCGYNGRKKIRRYFIEGYIQKGQVIKVYVSYDRKNFELFDTIEATSSYTTDTETILLGTELVGVGILSEGEKTEALYFRKEKIINTPVFKEIQFKFVADGYGYCAITSFGATDLRLKGEKDVEKYIEVV
ncbi:MAG: hypothetical protein N2Z85_02040 [Patescibacteria group bacterium]|nr:hypothetical protein [Patescibacteria group bacterium]